MFDSFKLTNMLAEAKQTLGQRKKQFSTALEILIFWVVYMVASVPQSIIVSVAAVALVFQSDVFDGITLEYTPETIMDGIEQTVNDILSNLPWWYMAVAVLSSGVFIIAAILYCKLFEKRKPSSLGFRKKGLVAEYGLGILIGAVMITVVVLACVLTGCVELKLAENINIVAIVIYFVAFLLQGMGEEALFRGYLMTTLARQGNIWIAIIFNSLLFSFFHIGNSSFSFIAFINILLFGIFASAYMLKRGSIWGVGAIHSIWNFMQGNIFGFNVSGNPKMPTVFEATQGSFGSILSGGDFGPEGGLGVTVIMLIAILVVLLMPTKKSELAPEPEKKPEPEYYDPEQL